MLDSKVLMFISIRFKGFQESQVLSFQGFKVVTLKGPNAFFPKVSKVCKVSRFQGVKVVGFEVPTFIFLLFLRFLKF